MQPTRFGKYLLLDRLAVGGMAEVYRGKLIGEQGFEKIVVIKRMLPQMAVKDEMVTAFIDEARLAALLQHENIIHVYDFGEMDGGYFIAMEYLFGQELRAVMDKSLEAGRRMPLADSLYIAARICDGLHYAHELKDLHQRSLNIIHRDVSPQNIFVTYDGKVKIIDFGIAKTSLQSVQTQTGLVKGKLAYMSPEQAKGLELDRRSDIFAAGAVLYEMLTGRRMVQGTDIAQVLQKVIEADFPPPDSIRADLPAPVCAVLKRALAKDKFDRYENIEQMLADIEECVFALSLRGNPQSLSREMKGLFEREFTAGTEDLQMVIATEASSDAAITGPGSDVSPPVQSDAPTSAADLDGEGTRTETISLPSDQRPFSNPPVGRKPAASKPQPDGKQDAGSKRFQPDRRSNTQRTIAYVAVTALIVASMVWLLATLKPKTTQTPVSETPPVRVALEDHQEKTRSVRSETNNMPPQAQQSTDSASHREKAAETVPERAAPLEQPTPGASGPSDAVAEPTASKPAEERGDRQVSPPPVKRKTSLSKKTKAAYKASRASVQSAVIQSLLAEAEKHLKNYRLTTPEKDCAYFYFKEVLRLDPRNADARNGIGRIGDAYGRLADREISRFQYEKAQSYVDTGLSVAPRNARLLALKKELARPRPLIILEDVGDKVKDLFE